MLFAGTRVGDTTATIQQAVVYGRLGWRCFGESRILSGSNPDQSGFIANANNGARLRWRGAAAVGPGTGFRNRHWNSSATKYIPLTIKATGAAVSVDTGTGQATWTGFAPTVQTPVAVLPGLGQATWTGLAPTVALPQNVQPGTGQATWSGLAPTVQTPRNVLPGVGQATWTGLAPTVNIGTNVLAGTGVGTWAGFAPTVAATQNVTAAPGTGIALWAGFAPTVIGTGGPAPESTRGVNVPRYVWEGYRRSGTGGFSR